jgi:hypothetical protein
MFPPNFPGWGSPSDDGEDQVENTTALSVFSSSSELWAEVKRLRREVDTKAETLKAALDGKLAESKPILVLAGPVSRQDLQQVAEMWGQRQPEGMVLLMPPDVDFQTLNDEELKQCGLKRIARAATNGYDEMLLEGGA